jgi:hypothetical protein
MTSLLVILLRGECVKAVRSVSFTLAENTPALFSFQTYPERRWRYLLIQRSSERLNLHTCSSSRIMIDLLLPPLDKEDQALYQLGWNPKNPKSRCQDKAALILRPHSHFHPIRQRAILPTSKDTYCQVGWRALKSCFVYCFSRQFFLHLFLFALQLLYSQRYNLLVLWMCTHYTLTVLSIRVRGMVPRWQTHWLWVLLIIRCKFEWRHDCEWPRDPCI